MSTKTIHVDHNGVTVTAETVTIDGKVMGGHKYRVHGLQSKEVMSIEFQKGPVGPNGTNGLTNEALLMILIDRTEALNDMFPCVQNRHAIHHMKMALELFEARTKERQNRGVEGQNKA